MSTINYTVTIASAKFLIDGAVAPKLTFRDGDTYVFDQADSSNAGHILQFSITSNNSGSAEYVTGVTKTGTAGQAGAKTTIITSGSTTDTLYYYSSGGGTYGEEFSNSGFNTSTNFDLLKPIVGGETTAEKWGPMINHSIDQIDQRMTHPVGESHIIPDVLYPSVAGKLLDGSTSHSGAYGTAQSDSRSYYYTDIKGSKPIKDSRIGAHFGSQRHKFRSLQLLEQETATHGENVFSIDGREWCRITGADTVLNYDEAGNYVQIPTAKVGTLEITGYFNDFNMISMSNAGRMNDIDVKINGANTTNNTEIGGSASVVSPLYNRYVDPGSIINIGSTISGHLGTSPKINTLTITPKNTSGELWPMYGIELIAQDTSNRNNIQIPSQNVVSYGKKFTVSGTPHYNPFAFAGDGTTAVAIGDTTSHGKVATGWTGSTSAYFDSTLDTATSLGLSAWETGGDFYRPINGGRVVRWVDSSGNIKTSVNMMPPTGTAIGNASDAALPTSHAWTTVYQPKLSSTTIDHSQTEVAKKFWWREFGNGAANGGGNSSGGFPDYSMVTGINDDIAYVMDDGLTSVSHFHVATASTVFDAVYGNADQSAYSYLTFIGTGLALGQKSPDSTFNIAQNLPYGTHILYTQPITDAHPHYHLDGVDLGATTTLGNYGKITDIIFYQPKKPPIPEDAVVIADYMLMADFVARGAGGHDHISKGVRALSATRDVFHDVSGGAFTQNTTIYIPNSGKFGMFGASSPSATDTSNHSISFFGTNAVPTMTNGDAANTVDFGGATDVSKTKLDNTDQETGDSYLVTAATLGVNTMKTTMVTGGNRFVSYDLVSPIHTSSHYQTFETPFLHELVGGDRNLEQNNLVVTPDGKTWNEVTRDVSYLGNIVLSTSTDTATTWANPVIFDEWRGTAGASNVKQMFNKDSWAIAYDRMICLKDGWYEITLLTHFNTGDSYFGLFVNDSGSTNGRLLMQRSGTNQNQEGYSPSVSYHFQRGDFLRSLGEWGGDGNEFNFLQIKKL